jgi:serine/threonine-protein kinase
MAELPQFDDAEIVSRLQVGPIAELYHAIQKPLGRPVLIKALSSSILPSSPFATTLEREAQLLSELHHPNVLHLYDFVKRDDRMWLVLEFVDGWTLEHVLRSAQRLPDAAAAAIALEIARALEHAHERGIVHRDVAPRNVMISRSGAVKLVNFTVAVDERLPTAPELLDGATASGPAYMSPELILGERADPRSDVYSLGVVLYEMVSGRRPFDSAEERSSTTQRIRHDPPPPLARGGVAGSLERIVRRCLEKLPSDRFLSASELAVSLERALTELGGGSTRSVVGKALTELGLVEAPPPSERLAASPPSESRTLASMGAALGGLLFCTLLVVAGGVLIQRLGDRAEVAARGSTRLELVPDKTAYLRVVAEPWAHVVVDGQHVETTPFSRAIPLPAGTHYVRFEHPRAAAVRRTVVLAPGETLLLDVKLDVRGAAPPETNGGSEIEDAEDAGPDAPPSP